MNAQNKSPYIEAQFARLEFDSNSEYKPCIKIVAPNGKATNFISITAAQFNAIFDILNVAD